MPVGRPEPPNLSHGIVSDRARTEIRAGFFVCESGYPPKNKAEPRANAVRPAGKHLVNRLQPVSKLHRSHGVDADVCIPPG